MPDAVPPAATERKEVVVAGGGVAGLETLLALRTLLGDRVELTLVTDTSLMLERPVAVAEPFARAIARNHNHDVRAFAAGQRVKLRFDRLVTVNPSSRSVMLGTGAVLTYDALVVATGARLVPALPGATTFRRQDDVAAMRAIVDDLREGRARSVVFALPDGPTWPLPLYELALMTGAELRADRIDGVSVTIVTPEPRPLAIFGVDAGTALGPLLEDRGVTVRTGTRAVQVQSDRLLLDDGASIAADRVVALAAPTARPVIGLPIDPDGFVPVDAHGRVTGVAHVYAAGDVTAMPLKQGGLAAQQGDAVAEAIAAELGVIDDPRPFLPVVRGLLLVGGPPLYLRTQLGDPASTRVDLIPGVSTASRQALWWPPAKVATRYLAAHFCAARTGSAGRATLTDRSAPKTTDVAAEHAEALALALALADSDARWGDFDGAVRAVEAAAAIAGTVPAEYRRKLEQWQTARSADASDRTASPPRG